jgi:hypothetical protein
LKIKIDIGIFFEDNGHGALLIKDEKYKYIEKIIEICKTIDSEETK